MPQAANIVVKNGATTPVDKTFELISPAAGDGGIGRWYLKEGAIMGAFPLLTLSSTPTSNRSRVVKLKIRVPSSFTEAATGKTIVGPAVEGNLTVSVPDDFPENGKNDAVAYISNLIGHSLIRSALRDAVPLT